ncbi:MAG: hypothetical protein ACYDG2_22830, partial [Ruminiclostridium sp.]
MKTHWTIKNLFTNYRVLMIILGLEYVFQFTQIKKHTLPQMIFEIYNTFIVRDDNLEFVSGLSTILFQELTYLILLICIFSGVLFIYKKVIRHESYYIGDFIHGLENNWKKVLAAGVFFTFTLGQLTDIVQWFVSALKLSEDMKFVYLKATISTSLSLFYTSLVIYGSIVLIENEFRIRSLFQSTVKFIFSKEAFKLYIIMLLAGILLQPINYLKSHYLISSSLLGNGNLFSLLDHISAPKFPLWLECLEWFINTIITSFIILYTSLTFYWNSIKNEFLTLYEKRQESVKIIII